MIGNDIGGKIEINPSKVLPQINKDLPKIRIIYFYTGLRQEYTHPLRPE